MALLSPVRPVSTGTLITPAPVSGSDTVDTGALGTAGALLIVINGNASSDTVAITDSGVTPAGSAGTSTGGAVAASTMRGFYISPRAVNNSTGVVTVTHTVTSSVTCYLLPLG